MSPLSRIHRPAGGLALAALVVSVWSCDLVDPTGPTLGGALPFVRDITVSDFQELVAEGPVRAEIALLPGGLTAREVVIQEADALAEPERVVSRIVGFQPAGEGGLLTLGLGGLQVAFGPEAAFRLWEGQELTFGAFVEHVQAALAEGHEPVVRAKRAAPDLPQDPDDASFLAASLVLGGELDGASIRMNVDADNVEVNANPAGDEPDAWVRVLGLRIQLRVRDGITRLDREQDEFLDEVEFEGHVASVDLESHSFRLEDGTLVRLVEKTVIRDHHDGALRSLGAVKEALNAGHDVVAYGHGGVESVEPFVLVAIELTFAVVGAEPEVVEFEGHVASVDLEGQSFRFEDGTVIHIVGETVIEAGDDHGLNSLAAVREALAAGKKVVGYGHGRVEAVEPLVVAAAAVTFAVARDP